MRFRIILADSGLEAVFAVRRKAINQAAMMRDKAQRQHLTDQAAFLAVSAQIEPKKLRSGGGVVNFASLLAGGVDSEVFLEYLAVFAEIMEQAQQPACLFRSDFLGEAGAEAGRFLQMLGKGLFCLVSITAAGDGRAVHFQNGENKLPPLPGAVEKMDKYRQTIVSIHVCVSV